MIYNAFRLTFISCVFPPGTSGQMMCFCLWSRITLTHFWRIVCSTLPHTLGLVNLSTNSCLRSSCAVESCIGKLHNAYICSSHAPFLLQCSTSITFSIFSPTHFASVSSVTTILTSVVFALEDGSVEAFGRPAQRALAGRGGREDRGVVPLSLLHGAGLVTQNVHKRSVKCAKKRVRGSIITTASNLLRCGGLT